MAPTPSKSNLSTPLPKSHHQPRTPQSKHRLNFGKEATANAASAPPEHPVEVVGRIRDHLEQKNKANMNPSALQISGGGKSLRLKTEIGYRDFSLDGVSLSEEDDLEGFYKKFLESRINGVKMGQKCTIMMYGPTGSGKSYTMFGCLKQPGIVYNSLKGILGEEEEEDRMGLGTFVQVTVLEIYNEEIYDLLCSGNNGGGFSFGWPKSGSASKVKLEVMGKKVKNATFISGNEAGKILKEIQKVEKRRIVKSTLCNERSSRSHCMIIVDVPTVGGRLMLVDMAGSENIEQAGQNGLEAKMQTAKINQGNIALKRVVESIANGDSHVPFRDSKLTMLLQDSFEDDKSKILMILCASPDPKELHKTIATLEYGAKAKCIVRGPQTPIKDKGAEDSSSAVILGSRIAALDQFIRKLQMENKIRENERNDAQKELTKKEEEVSRLRAKLAVVEEQRGVRTSEEEINSKVSIRTEMVRRELEKKILECRKMANEQVEMERRRMEERIFQQQQEVEMLRRRLEDIESKVCLSVAGDASGEMEGGSFMKRLMDVCCEESDMVESMDLERSFDMETNVTEGIYGFPNKACLMTVYEEEEYENDDEDNKDAMFDDEVQKEVIEEKKIIVEPKVDVFKDSSEHEGSRLYNETENTDDADRLLRIQNIFSLCGNHRELLKTGKDYSASRMIDEVPTLHDNIICKDDELVENCDDIEVYVKWEASKENHGNVITTLKVPVDSTLADLRKLVEIHLGGDQQAFTFLVLGDPSGAPVPREKEATTHTTKLPVCNDQRRGHLACLCPVKASQWPNREPFSPVENKFLTTPTRKKVDDCFSPHMGPHLSSTHTPFITMGR